MKSATQVLIGFVSLLSLVTQCSTSSGASEGASFLNIPVGAGPAALGSAYAALATDAYAPVYNPAGLGFLRTPQVAAQHLNYLAAMHYEFGSFVIPLGPGEGTEKNVRGSGLGVSLQYLGSGDIAGTDATGASIGNFSAHYGAYALSYGRKLTDRFSVGATGKLVEAKIADTSAKAIAGDVGMLYSASDKILLAATAQNIGSKLTFSSQGDNLPLTAHLCGSYQIQKHFKATVEGIYSQPRLIAAHLGTEWNPLEALSLRAGYKSDTTKGLSPLAGFTAGLGVHVWGQEFAYAWLPYGDLGDTQYFSLLLKFGAQEDGLRHLIEYRDIKTHRPAIVSGYSQWQASDAEYEDLKELLSERTPTLVENKHP